MFGIPGTYPLNARITPFSLWQPKVITHTFKSLLKCNNSLVEKTKCSFSDFSFFIRKMKEETEMTSSVPSSSMIQ